MSHIPASKMPHVKSPDDEHAEAGAAPLTDGPEIKPTPPKPPKGGKSGDHGATPYVAIAAVGALAIGGIVAALALRRPEPPHKGGKGKGKGKAKGRAHKHDAA